MHVLPSAAKVRTAMTDKRTTRKRQYALEQKQKLDETITEDFHTRNWERYL